MNLPVETLGEIFSFLLEPEPTEDTLEHDCISTSQVCLRWRQVALATPTLWTRIPASYPEWVFTLLKRSASQNVQVEFSQTRTNPHQFPTLLRWLLRYRSDRIDSISLVNITSVFSSLFPYIPIFPKLQRFRYQPHSNEMPASDRSLLQGILRKTKHLCSLTLPTLVDFCQRSIYMRNMTELAIGDCFNVQGASIREWLDTLKDMPNLQRLLVNGQLPWSSVEEQDVVSLPHLEYIILHDEILSIAEFLPRIRFPPTTILLLVLDFQEADLTEIMIDELRSVMERVLRNYHDVGVWQCIRLAPYFTDDEIQYPSFSAWHGLSAADWSVREEPPPTYPQVCVALKVRGVNDEFDVLLDILAETAGLMKCKDVEYLEIRQSEYDDLDEGGCDSAIFAKTVVNAFQDMDSLRTISCQAFATSALLKFISTYNLLGEGHEPHSTQPPLFKALQTMQFVSYGGSFKKFLNIPLIFEMLRTRHQAGHPVASVAFYTCELPQAFFQQRQAMTGSEYRPWGQGPIKFEQEVVEEIQVHMDDLETTFYFHNCANVA